MNPTIMQIRRNSESTEWITVPHTFTGIEAKRYVDNMNSDYGWTKYRMVAG